VHDIDPSALRHPVTAVKNKRKQEFQSPANVSFFFLVLTFYCMVWCLVMEL